MNRLLSIRPSPRRPLLWAAVFCLGALAMGIMGLSLPLTLAILAAAALAALALTRKSLAVLMLALALSSLMAVRFYSTQGRAAELAEKYDGVETELSGKLHSVPSHVPGPATVELDTELGLIQLTRYNGTIDGEIGDTVTVKARLSQPEAPVNDYGFDNRAYLYSRGIFLTAETAQAPRITSTKRRGLLWTASKAREHALRMGEKHLGGRALELYGSVVFGDKDSLSSSLKTVLEKSGLNHIAAVSGMHLSVVAVILMFLLSMLFGRRPAARLLTIPVMAFFALVTGGEPSVVRAFIMNTVFQLSFVFYRENDSLSALSLAFMLMCGFNPMTAFSVGFQLSAAATLGIILFAGPLASPVKCLAGKEMFSGGRISRIAGKALRRAGEIVAVSLGAQLGTFPILAYYFHYIATYSLLSNLLVVPLLTPVMASGLLLAIMGSIPVLGNLPALICGPLLELAAFIAEKIAALPGAALPLGRPDILLIAAYAGLLAAILAGFKRRRLAAMILAIFFAVTSAAGLVRLRRESGAEELCFINVGRGDCALFKLKDVNVLIDGGKGTAPADYLSARGIFSLDCAVLTSAGIEHVSGMIELADGGFIKDLYIPSDMESTDRLETLLLSAAENGVNVKKYSSGGSIYIGGLTLNSLGSDGSSVQLLAEYGGKRILFCGDGYMDWTDCDLVKLPSHGSGGYNYYGELSRYKPRFAVMTAAGETAAVKSGQFKVLQKLGIPCYIPDRDGTVTVDLSGDLTVTTTREKYQ